MKSIPMIMVVLLFVSILLPGCTTPSACNYTGTRIDIQTPIALMLNGTEQSLNSSYTEHNLSLVFEDEAGHRIEWTVFIVEERKEPSGNLTVLLFNVVTKDSNLIKWKLDKWYNFNLTMSSVNEFVFYLFSSHMVDGAYSPNRLTFGENGFIKGKLKVKDGGDTIVFSLDKKYKDVDVFSLKDGKYDGVIRLTTVDWLFKVHFENLKDC